MLTLPISASLSYADECKLNALFTYPNQTESELDQAITEHRLADLDVDMVIPADCAPSIQRLIRALHQDLAKQRRALSAANDCRAAKPATRSCARPTASCARNAEP